MTTCRCVLCETVRRVGWRVLCEEKLWYFAAKLQALAIAVARPVVIGGMFGRVAEKLTGGESSWAQVLMPVITIWLTWCWLDIANTLLVSGSRWIDRQFSETGGENA